MLNLGDRVSCCCVCVLSLLAASSAGCGGSSSDAPATYAVTGQVTNGSEPLADIQVNLVPAGEGGIPSTGMTDAEGKFSIQRHTGEEGAIPGTYRVVLSDSKTAMDASAYSAGGSGPPKASTSRIPEKWQKAETSPQSVEVKAEDNVVNIDVSKG